MSRKRLEQSNIRRRNKVLLKQLHFRFIFLKKITKSKLTVEYALEMANKPMGVATYNYRQLPENIAKYLPTEEEFENILRSNTTN